MSSCCCCCPVTLVAVLIGAYFLYKKFFKKGEHELNEKNWKKDTVYLYQFPRPKFMPSYSPFCLKTETFLKINNINYENRYTMAARSKYGRLPFIEFNGEEIADSKIIEQRLVEHFNIKPKGTAYDDSVGMMASRMLDAHTFFLYLHYKILDNPTPMVRSFLKSLPSFLVPLLAPIGSYFFCNMVRKRIDTAFGGIYTRDENRKLFLKDMDSINEILSVKKFIGGDEMGTHDCTVFGHLGVLFYDETENYVKLTIKKDYPQIVSYLERVRKISFPDDFVTN